MRSPGILGWEREDDYMDWREAKEHNHSHNHHQPTGSPSTRHRRKSKEELSLRKEFKDSSPTSVSASSASGSVPASAPQHYHPHYNNYHNSNVFSPLRVPTEHPAEEQEREEEEELLPKLPAMRLDQRHTNRHKEEAKIAIDHLIRPSCLESIINNRHQQLSVDDNCSREIINNNEEELGNLISTLLVTVERKIERVNLDDLVFPCPACRNIDTDDPLLGCKCAGPEECTNEHGDNETCHCGDIVDNCHSFEVAGIKHIDSDDEEEVRMGFGAKRRTEAEVSTPRSIHDLPERVLNCLRLPGYADDVTGRLVLEFENVCANGKEKICPREIASYLLYLSRLHSSDRTKNGWTLVIRGGNHDDFDILDRALVLIQGRVNVRQALLLQNQCLDSSTAATATTTTTATAITSVDDAIINRRIPSRKDLDYHQQDWIDFYKEYDSVMSDWQAYGRQLVLEMSELKDSANVSSSLTPLSRLLSEETTRRTSRNAAECLAVLEERAKNVSHLDYVTHAVQRAKRLMEEVGNAATRLENSFESRRTTIRNFAVLRSIEEQAQEVLSWLCKKGEDILTKHARHAATTLTTARSHERDFEKFYFASMRHLDKGSDLAEAAGTSGLGDLAHSLREHLRDFGTRLEDRREYLEDTSRCCLLQDRAQEWAHEARIAAKHSGLRGFHTHPMPVEHLDEMMSLAEKLGNETLIEQCKSIRNKCLELAELRSGSAPQSPSLRRSFAAASESAAEYNSWDDDSNPGSCPTDNSPATGEPRSQLDNIAETGENTQQDLDTPPRSPAGRRLNKPPVNSHLQRSPSIAPAGMKAKKTILLIMREMIQTERDYVKSLEYIIENYVPELVREDIPQAMRGQRNVIFGNVEKIYEFHSQHFLRELEQCEHSPMMVGQCFLRHENKFYLYALYNKNKPNSDSLMAEYGTRFFKAKQLELGDKMDLASYLLKPVQRMGKYALLLQQLVKAGTDLSEQLSGKNEKDNQDQDHDGVKPIVEGEADLRAAEQMVRFQLRHGNDLLAMDSLRDCDVNVKEQGRLLRQNEFLVWQGKGKKCLRQVFLFEDLILFSKARRFPDRKNLDIYIYKHSIKTTDIGLTAVIADSPTKFEIWFRKRKPGDTYTLQCASEDIKKTWTEELSNLLWKQALRNREVRLAEMSSMGIGNKPCLDIRPSADQINDRSISVAQLSKTPRFRNSIAVSISDDSSRCSRRPNSVISVSSSSSSGGSSGGPQTALHLGLDASPRLHHRSTTLNSQCSVESGIIADISIVSDDGVDSSERSHWKSTLESPTSSHPPNNTSTPLQSPTSSHAAPVPASTSSTSSTDVNITSPYDADMSINL
ncbi:GSCOCG00010228001-RA-CDS [Cotesia congregata]|nr:GSCOCG00010228001-RA-CDS [Cotesia congregata]